MNETIMLILAGGAGALLGALFFGGLWWTVRKGLSSTRPARWFLGGLLLRAGIVLAGFHILAGGRWQRLAACLLGFALARWLATRLARTRLEARPPPPQEVSHAP